MGGGKGDGTIKFPRRYNVWGYLSTSGGISTHERLKRYSPAKLKNNSLFEDNANNMGFKSYNIGFAKKYINAGVQSIFIKSMKKMCGPSG